MTVSIIIPIYATTEQHLDYLVDCLASCVPQSDDVIVWDDGSTLDIRVATDHYPEVGRYGCKHYGKSYARNSAVTVAKYDLILPVDADDWLAPNAVEAMLEAWNAHGQPVYSDIWKTFPSGEKKYTSTLAFSCDEIVKKCIPAVSVLHSKEQWASIGGWPEDYNLYEDWLYNAKLMWMYCGFKVPHPLLYYRQHGTQSTTVAAASEDHHARVRVKYELSQYIKDKGDSEMPCCGSKRTGSTGRRSVTSAVNTTPSIVSQQGTATLDLSTVVPDLNALGGAPGPGKVWALYIGGRGMGQHDRRGHGSHRKYMRLKYGDRRNDIRAEDAVSRAAFEGGAKNCGFILLEQHMAPPVVKDVGEPPPAPVVKRKPKVVTRQPDSDVDIEEYKKTVRSLSLRELKDWLSAVGLTLEQVQSLRDAEVAGPNRIGAVKMFDRYIRGITEREV